jgi:hypothetical protein
MCFYSLLNLNASPNVSILFFTSMHDHVFMSHVWFECITRCLCSLFGLSASLCVFVPYLISIHCLVFIFLVQPLKLSCLSCH